MQTRTDILKTLALRLNPVVSRRLGVVLVVQGSAGSGKTWLVSQLFQGLKCRSETLHANASGGQWLKTLGRPKKLSATTQKRLAQVEAGEILEDSVLLKVLQEVLRELTPIVLQLEDVHEASPERLELILDLQAAAQKIKGVGLVMTSRNEIPSLSGQMMLEPLSKAEADALLLNELAAPIPSEAFEYIFDRARGHPLFSLEYLRYLTRQGSLWSDGKQWYWRAPSSGFVPVTVEALLENLLLKANHDPNNRAVLEALSVLKTPPKSLWCLVAGLSEIKLKACIADLETRLILKDAAFVHPLYQEVMSGLLSREQRQHRIRRLLAASNADLLVVKTLLEEFTALVLNAHLESHEEQAWLERVSVLAEQTGQDRFAIHCQAWLTERNSADDVEAIYDAADAVGVFDPGEAERLLQLILVQQPDHLMAGASLANLLCDRREFTEAEDILHALPEKQHSDPYWLGTKTMILAKSGRWQEVIAFFELNPAIMTVPDAYYAARAYYTLGDDAKAREVSAKRFAYPLKDFEKAAFYGLESGVLLRQGNFLEALEFINKQIQITRGLPSLIDLCTVLRARAKVLPRLLRDQEAYTDLREALALSLEIGDLMRTASCQADLSREYVDAMQYPKAEALLLEAEATQQEFGNNELFFSTKLALSELYFKWRSGHGVALAQKYARSALMVSQSLQHKASTLLALCHAAKVEASLGQASQALKYALEAWQILLERQSPPEEHVQCLYAMAKALEVNARSQEAKDKLQEALALSQEFDFQRRFHFYRLELARLEHDLNTAKEELLWFEKHDTAYMIDLAKQYFPELETQSKPIAPQKLPTVFLNVLGSVQLVKDGKTIAYRGRKRLEFLLLLLEARVLGQSEVATSKLIDVLYPEMMEVEGKAALKQVVYQLRNILGTGVIQSTAKGYALGNIASDAEAFLETRNANCWRDAYLADLPELEPSELRDRLIHSLRLQLEILIETNALETARLGQILLEMEPYDRDALELTLRALKQSGQSTQIVYQNAKQQFLELGETLPSSSDAFLGLVV
jgi:DNA-binding SARP family transcriptional activator